MRRREFLLTSLTVALAAGRLSWAADAATSNQSAQIIELSQKANLGKPAVITAVAIAPGAKLLATAGDDHVVRLWNTETGLMANALKGH